MARSGSHQRVRRAANACRDRSRTARREPGPAVKCLMPQFQILPYAPDLFDTHFTANELRSRRLNLLHRPFTDYYYGSSRHCRLYLALDADGCLAGTQGIELMPFVDGNAARVFGFGSNFHAFKPGAGAYLFLHTLRHCDAGLVFGGSGDFHRMTRRARWRYYEGTRTYHLNHRFDRDQRSGPVKRWVGRALTVWSQRNNLARLNDRLPSALAGKSVCVEEQSDFVPSLLEFESAFPFRFAPDLAYLSWRYHLRLPFVRYRLFALEREGRPAGYVILQDESTRIIVAAADASDPLSLACGIVKSLGQASNANADFREVVMVSAHPAMQDIFAAAGFQNRPRWDRPFALGRFGSGFDVASPVSQWLVNYGWGDNGLRAPFPDIHSLSREAKTV